MIIHGKALVSEDVFEKKFICDLGKCKGACCIEGEFGAPLDREEIRILKKELKHILPYLSTASQQAIEKNGFWERDDTGEAVTTCLPSGECNFSFRDSQGVLSCGIEKAWKEKKTGFRKPVSCHLYPIRITKSGDYDAVNYDRWEICKPACKLGEEHKVPVYRFLKEALIRRYGEAWYEELDLIAKAYNNR